jgi:hypothetical protein
MRTDLSGFKALELESGQWYQSGGKVRELVVIPLRQPPPWDGI